MIREERHVSNRVSAAHKRENSHQQTELLPGERHNVFVIRCERYTVVKHVGICVVASA